MLFRYGYFLLFLGIGAPVALWAQSPRVTLALVSNDTICPGDSVMLSATASGFSGPFQFVYLANGVAQPTATAQVSPFLFKVVPTATTLYQLDTARAGGAGVATTGEALVKVLTPLRATISGGGPTCRGVSDTVLRFDFEGLGPYTFTYAAGAIAQPPVTTSQNPYFLRVRPASGTIYRLRTVRNAYCEGMVTGIGLVQVFTSSTASLAGDKTLCNDGNTTLPVDFTGTGPFLLTYSIDGAIQPTIETFDDPWLLPVRSTGNTTVRLVGVTSPGCTGTVSGSATVRVNRTPSFALAPVVCDAVQGTYTVRFQAIDAVLPLTIVGGGGTFTGTTFTSNPIPQAQPYRFQFRDANNCGLVTVSGNSSTCNCTSRSGSMDLTALEVCANDTVRAIFNQDAVRDANDVTRFILHTTPSFPLGDVIGWSDQPNFAFSTAQMALGETYYISSISGNRDATGRVDLTDPCLSVGQGTPVRFFALPAARFGPDITVCQGQEIQLPVSLTGASPFSLTYTVNGAARPPVSNLTGGSTNLTFRPDAPVSTLVIQRVGDSRQCATLAADTMVVRANLRPAVSNLSTVCDPVSDTYRVSFEARGQEPFAVSGLTGTFTGGIFTSLPLPQAAVFTGTLSDAARCGLSPFNGIGQCFCGNRSGTMRPAPLTACDSAAVTAVHNGDQVLATGDVLSYVLHTSVDTTLGTILASAATPQFAFRAATMQRGVTYYISAVTGNNDGTGLVALNDRCIAVAAGTPVTWYTAPVASLSGALDACPGETRRLTVNLTGTAPFQLTYTVNNIPLTTTVRQNIFPIDATQQQTTQYGLVRVSDANCTGRVEGNAVIRIRAIPEAINVRTVCSLDGLSYNVEFDLRRGDRKSAVFTGLTGRLDTATGRFVSSLIPLANRFTGFIADQFQCGRDTVSGAAVCPCRTEAGTLTGASLTLCAEDTAALTPPNGGFLQPGDTLLYALTSQPGLDPAAWMVVAWQNRPRFVFNPATMRAETPYFIYAVAANRSGTGNGFDLTDTCLSVSNSVRVIWRRPIRAELSGMDTICAGNSARLRFRLSGSAPFVVGLTANGVAQNPINIASDTFSLPVSPAVTTAYVLTTVNAQGCRGVASGTANIAVQAAPSGEMRGDTSICPGSNAVVQLRFTGQAPFRFTYLLGTTPLTVTTQNNFFNINSFNIQQPQRYRLAAVQDARCAGVAVGSATLDLLPSPVVGFVGDSRICPGDSALLALRLEGGDSVSVRVGSLAGDFDWRGATNGDSIWVKPIQTTDYRLLNVQVSGARCAPVIRTGTATVTVTPIAVIERPSAYAGGFGVRCAGDRNGSIALIPNQGAPPFRYRWNTGDTSATLRDLPAGVSYAYTVTDQNNCRVSDSIRLRGPDSLSFALRLQPIRCNVPRSGGVQIDSIANGNGPFTLVLDPQGVEQNFDRLPRPFVDLTAGVYSLLLEDAGGCSTTRNFRLETPPSLDVFLDETIAVPLGESIELRPIVQGVGLDSVRWSPDTFLLSPDSLITSVKPTRTTQYRLWVRDSAGCTATGKIVVIVQASSRVFIPNAIHPGSGETNEVFAVYGGPEVVRIRNLSIYDRWGECLYAAEDVAPNDTSNGWNGRWRNRDLPPGVYVYRTVIEFIDGTVEERTGDVTIVR